MSGRKNIKAVFLDIDGTMVSFKTHRMSEDMYNALCALQKKGIKVVVASGRPVSYIDNVRDFPFDAWIGCNGAMTVIDGKLVFSHPISREDAVAVAKISTEHSIPSYTFGVDGSVEGINCTNERSEMIRSLLQIRLPKRCDIVKLCQEEDIFEFTTYVTKEEEEELFRHGLKNVEYIRWHPMFTDINPGGMDKGKALEELMSYWGFVPEEAIAFGDGGNDIPMLRAAGTGFAMEGSAEDVVAAADALAPTVDEDGVVQTLEKLKLI